MALVSEPASATPHRALWRHLYFQVLCGVALGILVGALWPPLGAALEPLASGFIKLVRMIIAPVIFLSIVTGIAHLGGLGELGRVAWKAMAYFLALSTLALIVGLLVANGVQPGVGMNVDPATLDASAVSGYARQAEAQTISGFLLSIIPNTLPSGLVGGEILQVLLVAVLVGVAATLVGARAQPFVQFCQSTMSVVFRVVDMLMTLAPLGAFGGMAYTVGKFGLQSLATLGGLIGTFYLTSALFIALVLGTVARLAGFSLWRLLRYLRGELLLVLGTSSSEAALPRLMEKLEGAGCERRVVSVVVPTGYSFNLDGTNIYMTLAALFLAQAIGTQLTLGDQLALLLVAIVSSKGAAGVTGSGFITLAATLSIVPAVPVAAMALIVGIDRFMSECRALTNFIGNAVATVVVARWEGALDRERLRSTLETTQRPD